VKRVAILTNFNSCDQAYSLNRVVQDQIKMLTKAGYEPIVIVAKASLWDNPPENYGLPGVELRYVPNVPVSNEVKTDETFDQDVISLRSAIAEALEGVDVVLTHDIIYQPAALKHNVASRMIAKEKPNLLWLHWIHSATSPYTLINLRDYFKDEYLNVLQTPFPNSFYIFFNDYSIPRIAKNFGVGEEDVKVVHHPTDYCRFFRFSPALEEIVDDKKMLFADAICVFPARLDRGKQVEMAIKIMASLKKLGRSVKMIVVDFHSTGGDKVTYREELKHIGIDWGLNEDELLFTSDLRPEWKYEVPQEIVSQLQVMANVFVMPSKSESYSLVTQEAALAFSVGVLNSDFPPFRDIFGSGPFYQQFSSNIDALTGQDGETTTKYENEKGYMEDIARKINYELSFNRVLTWNMRLRKERNLEAIFRNELEPLINYEKVK